MVKHIENKYYILLVIITVIVSLPSNFIFYVAPIIIVLFSLHNNFLISRQRLLSIFIVYVILYLLSVSLNAIEGYSINYISFIYGLITYSSFIILLSIYNKGYLNDQEIGKVVYFLSYFLIIQSCTVFFQMSQTGNWDALSGTFGLFDYKGRITISQVMFCFNIYVIMLFLLAYIKKNVVKIALIFGIISTSAAQSGHQFIFLIITILIVYVSLKNLKLLLKYTTGISLTILLVLLFFPETIDIAAAWLQNILFGNYPKTLSTIDAFKLMYDNVRISSFGTGIGQFTSRASLFSSGEYLGVNIPDILTDKSSFYTSIVEPKLKLQEQIGEGSAIAKPYYSALSLLVEFGLIIFGVIIYYVVRFFRKNKDYYSSKNIEVTSLSKFMNAFILFLIMCSFIENYLEFVQAITVPILLFSISISRRNYLLKKEIRIITYK